jgi:hypothetical protein
MRTSSIKLKACIFVVLGALFLFAAREFYLRTLIDLLVKSSSEKIISVRMSRREARRLDYFFRKLMIKQPFAFTLIGSKPVSMTSFRNSLTPFSPSNYRFVLGRRTWEKYKHHFIQGKIRYWTEKDLSMEGISLIVIADFEQLNEIVHEHQQDFEEVLSEGNLDKLLQIRPFFSKALQNHDALIGMVLGFGKKNSWLYHRKFKDYFKWKIEEKLDSSRHLPSIWGGVIEQQARNLFMKSWTLRTWTAEDMILPSLVGDPDSEESKLLKQKYLTTREALIAFYKDKPFLEATLSLFLSDRNEFCRKEPQKSTTEYRLP